MPIDPRARMYWTATLILAAECIGGGIMGALRLPLFDEVIQHLGCPPYSITILGVWYVLAGFAVLVPKRARLKEWA